MRIKTGDETRCRHGSGFFLPKKKIGNLADPGFNFKELY
jgi:hypothetical protein